MTEHKFTDADIIKALEHYKGFRLYPFDKYQEGTDVILVDDALDLINRQRAEIERLHNILLSFTNEVHTWSNKNGYDTTGLSLIPILNEAESVRETIKAEAVKEFAENIKTYYDHIDKTVGALINYTIDQKLKEFLGEGGGKENG